MEKFLIAQLGRTVGLWGDLKLHLHTDFLEQFKIGSKLNSSNGILEIIKLNQKRDTVRFRGYETIDSAKKLTNTKIYASKDETLKNCNLKKDEFFWFDIIDCQIEENNTILGKVKEVQRFPQSDYLFINTSKELIEKGSPNSFLIPYIKERYILKVDIENKKIFTQDTKDILEES